MNKQWREYYSRNIDIFVENFLGIKLLPFQRMILKSYNKKLDKQAILDMAKFYNPQSDVYMNMYYWSIMGSKYGYDRCKMAEEVVLNETKYR